MRNVQTTSGYVPPRIPSMPTSAKRQSPLFTTGKIVATPAVLKLLERTGFTVEALIKRHVSGDFGDVDGRDAAANDAAVRSGARITSVYRLLESLWLDFVPRNERSQLPTVWIVTDAASEDGKRATTTILRPQDL